MKNNEKKILFIAIAVMIVISVCFAWMIPKKSENEQTASSALEVVTEAQTETTTEEVTDAKAEATTEAITDNYENGPSVEDETESQNESRDDSYDKTQSDSNNSQAEEEYKFKNNYCLEDHYEKHGKEMGFKDKESYEEAASDVVNNPDALHKIEKEDGDDVYYVEKTNEFVVVSPDGYIRTYFNPDDGIDYYNRQ